MAKTTASDLTGTWSLESWSLVYEDGRPSEYPLGRDAVGRIMYTHDGHISAQVMRAGRKPLSDTSDRAKAQAWDDCFAYAGRFEVRDEVAYHSIEVATNPALVGVTSTRHILLDGNRLTLSGPDFSPDSPRHHRIVWRRVMK